MRTEKERFYSTYSNLVQNFIKQIEKVDVRGIPEPHLPCIGSDYLKSNYKLAFFGKETKGWGDLKAFMNDAKVDPVKAIQRNEGEFDDLEFVDWTNNFKTSFWDFILQFLAVFYGISDMQALKINEKYYTLLRSFIWGNTNSIERYEVTAKGNEVPYDNWEKVKNASRIFDNPKYILEIYKPRVLFILNWDEDEKWLTGSGSFIGPEKIDDNLWYYHRRDTDTHVLWGVHPRYAAPNIGFPEYIDQMIETIKGKKAFLDGPSDEEYGRKKVEVEAKSSNAMIEKKEYLYRLADFLRSQSKVMSGGELADHLNRNRMFTEYGTPYGGGRGIYTLIRAAWNYYTSIGQNKKAEAIAESFVNEGSEYAYE